MRRTVSAVGGPMSCQTPTTTPCTNLIVRLISRMAGSATMGSLFAHQICTSRGTISLIAAAMARWGAHGSEPTRMAAFRDKSSLDMVTVMLEAQISILTFHHHGSPGPQNNSPNTGWNGRDQVVELHEDHSWTQDQRLRERRDGTSGGRSGADVPLLTPDQQPCMPDK